MARAPVSVSDLRKQIAEKVSDNRLIDWIRQHGPFLIGPHVSDFQPRSGAPGTAVTITGSGFSSVRLENEVTVGNASAFVVMASATQLKVVTADTVTDGPVKVTVAGHGASGPTDFDVTGYPSPGSGDDGPPVSFAGAGAGSAGDVDPIGTIRLLVVLLNPNDSVPANPATARSAVQTAWNNVVTYYKEASYGKTKVQLDITTNWKTLDGTTADFCDFSADVDNVRNDQLDRILAQSAQHAVDEGFDLDNYAMMANVLFLNGTFIRALGGWSQQNFSYDSGSVHIDLTADHAINQLCIQESANWGRCAHEFGHNVVSAPNFNGAPGTATLGEDIYGSDLVDAGAASAQDFDLMGNHDTHPLFSGFHLDKLGYYDAANIKQLTWDRNPFKQDFDVVAHGTAQDSTSSRFHLIKIKIADGLHYFVQVRQRPQSAGQIFDDQIPLAGASNQGGVIVTSAVADVMNNNQQTRFITLLHPDNVLQQGDVVDDPARALKITVMNGAVATNPLVCRVRVEWAQTIADDPNGSFDLGVSPWDGNYQTPDIWIDRAPFGTFDQPLDPEGRPQGNGDKPRPLEINRFFGRIHVSGAMGATDVKVVFYAVDPPGVGDNGNWAPIGTQTIPSIAANSFADAQVNWTPVLGEHTCLKLYAAPQLGEVSGGNNFAQENVFDFESPASSPGEPMIISTAVRNPLDERRLVRIIVKGVPVGWRVQFPHSWVWLDAKAERRFDLVVIPMFDFTSYRERKIPAVAPVKLEGILDRRYDTKLAPSHLPAGSRYYPIGGTLSRVRIVKRADIKLSEDRERSKGHVVALRGDVSPAVEKQRVRVTLIDPAGKPRMAVTMTDAQGHFFAAFDLAWEPTLESDRAKWKKAPSIVSGKYHARAAIIAADTLAEAESNVVDIAR